MQLTVAGWDDRVFSVELDGDSTLSTLKAILEAESGLPAAQQQLVLQGRPLPPTTNSQTLSSLGVTDGELLMLLPMQQTQQAAGAGQQQQRQRQQQQQQDPMLELAEDGSAKVPAAFIQAIKGKPEVLASLSSANPSLAAAIRNEDITTMQQELRHIRKQQQEHQAQLQREQELLEADPFDPETQRRIEEVIQQKNIEENFMAALEHTPEVFAQVEMLYVNMEINGVPVKAFVDSGAQMTIMTHDFANKCHLGRLMDKRFAGMAVGVGSSRILGKIHQAPLKVGGHFTTCAITVLEQKDGPQFIFGLDMLKRHQCVLDFFKGELCFGSCDATLKFLPEHEIPKDFKRHIEDVTQQQAEKNVQDAAKAEAAHASGAGSSAAAATNTGSSNPTTAAADGGQPAAAAGGGGQESGPTNMDTDKDSAAVVSPSNPRQQQQQPQQQSNPLPAAGAAAVDESKVAQLMGLGFSREVAVGALQAMGGDVDAAASMLFGM